MKWELPRKEVLCTFLNILNNMCPFVPNNLFLWHFRVSLTVAEILLCNRVTETLVY